MNILISYDNVSDVVCAVRMGNDIQENWSKKLKKILIEENSIVRVTDCLN